MLPLRSLSPYSGYFNIIFPLSLFSLFHLFLYHFHPFHLICLLHLPFFFPFSHFLHSTACNSFLGSSFSSLTAANSFLSILSSFLNPAVSSLISLIVVLISLSIFLLAKIFQLSKNISYVFTTIFIFIKINKY
jgi:hypothetical protein